LTGHRNRDHHIPTTGLGIELIRLVAVGAGPDESVLRTAFVRGVPFAGALR
jgi:hypothetical protein